ncbi:MAG: hypothetical protein LIP23_00615 [Planctomycetes bacterium]|nr:hypothetical protein [Planctomycetota bacterium]
MRGVAGLAMVAVVWLVAALALPNKAVAQDDIQAATAVWSDFTAALRRGDYRRAHNMFSEESRAAMPYADFIQEYGPLSVAREIVLARPESMSTRVDGDWAEISFSGQNPGSGRKFRVGVALVRNLGIWALVAGRSEEKEFVEATARRLLADAATLRHLDNLPARIRGMAETLPENHPVHNAYVFEVDRDTLRAVPQAEGLRPFYVDAWGQVRPGQPGQGPGPLGAMPEPAATDTSAIGNPASPIQLSQMRPGAAPLPELGQDRAAQLPEMAAPPAQPALRNGLPEISEPPDPGLPPPLSAPPPLSQPPALTQPPAVSPPLPAMQPERDGQSIHSGTETGAELRRRQRAAQLDAERFSLPDSIE